MLWDHPFDRVIPRWLGRVDIPTLIVWGDDDRLLPPELAPAWAALLPDATVKTFPDAGHLVLDESPDAADAVARVLCRPLTLRGAAARRRQRHHRRHPAGGRRVRRATGRSMPEPYDREPTPESWDTVAVAAGFDGFAELFRAMCDTVPDEMIDPARSP